MKKKSKFINKCIFILFCISLYLGFKINEIKNFMQLPTISQLLPFEKWFQFQDEIVSSSDTYHHLIDKYYTNGSNSCVSILDGIILEVSETSIKVYCDNGIVIIYGELDNIIAKVDERILKGQILGEYSDSLTLSFTKDDLEISYEEAIKS